MKDKASLSIVKNKELNPKIPPIQGTQWIIELYQCDSEILNDEKKVQTIMIAAAEEAKATVVNHCFHRFAPQGVSGVVVISESHLAVHTWPEYGYCAIDLFTCSEDIDHKNAVRVLKEGFQCKEEKVFALERGIRNRSLNTLPLVSKD